MSSGCGWEKVQWRTSVHDHAYKFAASMRASFEDEFPKPRRQAQPSFLKEETWTLIQSRKRIRRHAGQPGLGV